MVSQLMREIRIEGAHSSGQRWHQLYGTFLQQSCMLHHLDLALHNQGLSSLCKFLWQVGGTLDSLHAHIKAVRGHDLFGDDIDFKLAASQGAASEQAASETGFKSLSVSICEVTSPSPSHGESWEPGKILPSVMSPLGNLQTVAHFQELQHPERCAHAGGCSSAVRSVLQPCPACPCSCAPCIATEIPQHHSQSRAAGRQGDSAP